MSKQLLLGEGFEKYAKRTRRAQFLSEMERIVPWCELCELVAPGFGEIRRTGQAHRGGAMCDALGPFSAVMGSFVLPLTAVTLAVLTYRHLRTSRSDHQH